MHVRVHLRLADGRDVRASPDHPMADSRSLAELQSGDTLDGSFALAARSWPLPPARPASPSRAAYTLASTPPALPATAAARPALPIRLGWLPGRPDTPCLARQQSHCPPGTCRLPLAHSTKSEMSPAMAHVSPRR